MMWNGFEGMGWGWIGLGLLHMVFFWGLVILALVGLVKWLSGGSESPPGRGSAMDILKARYAKGDLTREEFERMKREIAD
jgi:putative membrane protein